MTVFVSKAKFDKIAETISSKEIMDKVIIIQTPIRLENALRDIQI